VPLDATNPQETWCATVRVHDGQEYSPIAPPACVTVGTGKNHPPQVFSATTMVQRQSVGSVLRVTGIYSDEDLPCPYCNKKVETLPLTTVVQTQWFRDDALQPEFNNQTEITRSVTYTGESWHVTVQLFDGIDYSAIVKTPLVTFRDILTRNTPPKVENVRIVPVVNGRKQPGDPVDSDNLQVEYDFKDADGQLEQGSQIYWYNPLTQVTQYNGHLTIPYSETQRNQTWFVRVIPCDGLDCGINGDSDSVQIRPDPYNSPPIVENLRIIPSEPGITTPLELKYHFRDADRGDTEGLSQIRWTSNSKPRPQLDNISKVRSDLLVEGDTWCVIVMPVDIRDEKGNWSTSRCATIKANPNKHQPQAEKVYLSSTNLPDNQARKPADSENLELHYNFIDDDCFPTDYKTCEHDSEIHWYKDGSLQAIFDNLTVVSATATAPGQKWHATIRPHDGEYFGAVVNAPQVVINHQSELSGITFSPMLPVAGELLTATCAYTDADGDLASTLTYRWSRDGVADTTYDDQPSLPVQTTQAGQTWTVSCTPHDGIEAGMFLTATVNIKSKGYIYLPLIIKLMGTTPVTPMPTNTPGPAFEGQPCDPKATYEPNNERYQACMLQSGQLYTAYPNDITDYYAFVLTETVSVNIELTSHANGHLRLFYDGFEPEMAIAEQDLSQASTIPNLTIPQALTKLSPGKYYILVDTRVTSDRPYQLKITVLQ